MSDCFSIICLNRRFLNLLSLFKVCRTDKLEANDDSKGEGGTIALLTLIFQQSD